MQRPHYLQSKKHTVEMISECQCGNAQELERALMVISQLNETNARTQGQLEAVLVESDKRISCLEQEKHDLEMKLHRQTMMASSYHDDLESLQIELMTEKKKALKEMEMNLMEQIDRQRSVILNMESDVERSKFVEVKMTRQNAELEETVGKLKMQLKAKDEEKMPVGSFLTDDSEEVEALCQQKVKLETENCELQLRLESKEKETLMLRKEVQDKESDLSKLACDNTSFYNEKERLLEKIKALNMELEVAVMQSDKKQARGNSLFSEVEDRRVEVEKELIRFRVENDSLKTQLKLASESLNHAKMQLSVMWDMRSATESKHRLESMSLEMMKLVEENRSLIHTIKSKEEEEEKLKSYSNGRSLDAETRRYQVLYESKEKELGKTSKELQSKRMILIQTEDRLRNSEAELYSTKQELLAVLSKKAKVEIRLEELIMKYEPTPVEAQVKPKVEYVVEKLNFASINKLQLSADSTSSVSGLKPEAVVKEVIFNDKVPHITAMESNSGQSWDGAKKPEEPSIENYCVSSSAKCVTSKVQSEKVVAAVDAKQAKTLDRSENTGNLEIKSIPDEIVIRPIESTQPCLKSHILNKENIVVSKTKEPESQDDRGNNEQNLTTKKFLSLHDELAMLGEITNKLNQTCESPPSPHGRTEEVLEQPTADVNQSHRKQTKRVNFSDEVLSKASPSKPSRVPPPASHHGNANNCKTQ